MILWSEYVLKAHTIDGGHDSDKILRSIHEVLPKCVRMLRHSLMIRGNISNALNNIMYSREGESINFEYWEHLVNTTRATQLQ